MIPFATIHLWRDDDGRYRAHFDAVHIHGTVPPQIDTIGYDTVPKVLDAVCERLTEDARLLGATPIALPDAVGGERP